MYTFQTKLLRGLLLTVLIGLLMACGGGGGGGGSTDISYGTVTDFGSIVLNGNHLDDSTASVTLDDNPGVGSHGGLKQGMVVKASGNFSGNTGTVSSIEFRDNLEGPVCNAPTSVDGIRTLRVLGQTVILNATTTAVDNGLTIDDIALNDIVEVSGLPNELEQIIATFIEVKNLIGPEVEVKGSVDTVDNVAKTLTINDLSVNFSGIGVVDNSIPGGVPVAGQFVEVKGTIFACGATTDMLTATKVELEPEGAGEIPDGVRAEVEGFITELTAKGFKIGNKAVDITGNPLFLPEDFDASFLVVGAKVEAEGTSVNNVIIATKISFRRNVKIESDVDTGDISSFTLVGLPGITITTNLDTELNNIVTINSGDHIRVRGIEGPGNTVLATRIDDRSTSPDAFLQGTVDLEDGNVITVLGIPVDTSAFSDTPLANSDFENANDMGILRATFLELVELGTLVKFQGVLEGSPIAITWNEAELED